MPSKANNTKNIQAYKTTVPLKLIGAQSKYQHPLH